MAQIVDYQAVLADLERRRREFNTTIDGAIASIRRMLELTAGITSVVASPQSAPLLAMPKPYKDMSLPKAAVCELAFAKRGMTNQQIADALEKAGFVHGSSNFANLVGTALWRESQKNPKVVREGRQWRLREEGPKEIAG